MIDRLNTLRKHQYYERLLEIPDQTIEDALLASSATAHLVLTKVLRQPFNEENMYCVVSYIHFKRESLPFYLHTGAERDVQHGYCVIIEADNYLLITEHAADPIYPVLSNFIRKIPGPWRRLVPLFRVFETD